MTRTKLLALAFAAATAATAAAVAVPASAGHDNAQLLRTTVAGSLTTDQPIFGVRPGGAPWVVDDGSRIRLDADGDLDIRVEGLIIPTQGTNPVPRLSASVACNGVVVARTASVPFSTAGDARIRAEVMVPDRCLAPTVFLNPNDVAAVFIGVSGQE